MPYAFSLPRLLAARCANPAPSHTTFETGTVSYRITGGGDTSRNNFGAVVEVKKLNGRHPPPKENRGRSPVLTVPTSVKLPYRSCCRTREPFNFRRTI